MPVDSLTKRRAVAHIKRPGNGVTPGSTGTTLGRSAIAWSYSPAAPIPPPPGTGAHREKFTLGTKESLSVTGEPTLGGQFAW